jgi:hypothetical protein
MARWAAHLAALHPLWWLAAHQVVAIGGYVPLKQLPELGWHQVLILWWKYCSGTGTVCYRRTAGRRLLQGYDVLHCASMSKLVGMWVRNHITQNRSQGLAKIDFTILCATRSTHEAVQGRDVSRQQTDCCPYTSQFALLQPHRIPGAGYTLAPAIPWCIRGHSSLGWMFAAGHHVWMPNSNAALTRACLLPRAVRGSALSHPNNSAQ